MKIANVLLDGKRILGVINENKIYSFKEFEIFEDNLEDVIKKYTLDELKEKIKYIKNKNGYSLVNAKYLAPIERPSQDVLCLGLNYDEHIEESMKFKKEEFKPVLKPVYFSKRVTKAIGSGDYIDGHFDFVKMLDYECELAFIIGKDAYNVKIEDAYKYIFGFTIINDVSARDVQNEHKQWHFGKSLDTFCPMGPVVVTIDEIDCNNLDIKSYVNGELRQNSNTKKLIYKVDYIIENLTRGMTLKSGSIISTGTPKGVGMGFQPPKFLNSNDEVICEIEGLGKLYNKIK